MTDQRNANTMKELTKAELQVMQYLWKLKKGFAKDIVAEFPEPKPAYNTVSTILRLLVKKGFVGYKAYGKTHEYYPQVEREDYTRRYFKSVLKNFFADSPQRFASFFAKEGDLSLTELEEMKRMIEEQIEKQQGEKDA